MNIDFVYENKEKFVAEHLKPLLIAANLDITDAIYWRGLDTGEETITITFTDKTTRQIDVTADSLLTIVEDVINGIKKE